MDSVEYLVVGAGVSGLSLANWLRREAADAGRPDPDILVLEADDQAGGYCKTVARDGFVWDYSGHFFHFKHPQIEAWLRERMPGQEVRTVTKRSFIRFAGRDIDFPFQKNIHQLPREEFIDCLYELYFRDAGEAPPRSFKEMLERRLGRGICDRFLVPYNQKLYACDLDRLDPDAMGRFFPHADTDDIIRNMRHPDNDSYNATFTYPEGGAIQYIHALLRDLPDATVSLGERLESVDVDGRVATTSKRQIGYRTLVSSAPLDQQLRAYGVAHEPADFSWNKVLVFNLGFDGKGAEGVHWMYFPDQSLPFYRVGWYDNILGAPRMSLYVEIGATKDAVLDVDAERERVLDGLRREKIITDQQLVAWHSVILDPAYVHITRRSNAEVARLVPQLAAAGIHPVGRYGKWTYCSIEDNMIETRELAATLSRR